MLNRRSSNFIRLAAPLLALCFAGAALAEPNSNGAVAQALCLGQAQTQYLIELQQCTSQIGNMDAYNACRDMAQLHYALAQAACGRKASAVSSNTVLAMPRINGIGKLRLGAFGAGARPHFIPKPLIRGGLPQKPAGPALSRRR